MRNWFNWNCVLYISAVLSTSYVFNSLINSQSTFHLYITSWYFDSRKKVGKFGTLIDRTDHRCGVQVANPNILLVTFVVEEFHISLISLFGYLYTSCVDIGIVILISFGHFFKVFSKRILNWTSILPMLICLCWYGSLR